MASRVVRPETAFALSSGKKRPRQKTDKHRRFVATLPCLITGKRPVEVAHVRFADLFYGKPHVGIGEKPDDIWTVPLSPDLHREQHAYGDERGWWAAYGIDPLPVCLALWAASGDEEAGELIILGFRRRSE